MEEINETDYEASVECKFLIDNPLGLILGKKEYLADYSISKLVEPSKYKDEEVIVIKYNKFLNPDELDVNKWEKGEEVLRLAITKDYATNLIEILTDLVSHMGTESKS